MPEPYWTYKADDPPADPPPDTRMTREEWETLSPGMRRQIWRDYNRSKLHPT
jgi:hypothetical protein